MQTGLKKFLYISEIERFLTYDFLVFLLNKAAHIVIALLIGKLLLKVVIKLIRRLIKIKLGGIALPKNNNIRTFEKLMINTTSYIIRIIVFLWILSIIGVNISAVLAGAGILGIAIGFGMQNLIRDIIAGIFIVFEGQFSVGDRVKINFNLFEGVVEEIGMRTTKLYNEENDNFIIPNGNITSVINLSKTDEEKIKNKLE